MEDLSQTQKDVYNTYIANGIDKTDAEGLVRGTLSQEAYFAKLDAKEKPKDINSYLDKEGYDTRLIENVGKKVKERKESSQYLAESIPDDRLLFDALGFTKEEAFNFSGVRTDTDKELPGSIRFDLSFSLPNPEYKVSEAKKLYKKFLVEEKGLKPDQVEKYSDKIDFKLTKLGSGNDMYDALIYKTPKELGGDGMYYAANSPKAYPTLGDFKAVTGDAIPVTAAITGGTAGSFVSPILGTTLGSAASTFAGELTRLYIGRANGLHNDLSDEEFDKQALNSAALSASIDLVATPALLGIGQIIKNTVKSFSKPGERLTKDTIEKFIKSGGNLDSEITLALDDAKKVLIANGVDEKAANDYLAISISNAIPEAGIFPKGSKEEVNFGRLLNIANKRVQTKETERQVIKKLTGLDSIDSKVADDLIDSVGDRVKKIRQDELVSADKAVKDAFNNLSKTKLSFYKDPATSEIDRIAVTFNELTDRIKPKLNQLEDDIFKSAKDNKLKIEIDDKESVKVLNRILQKYSTEIKKELPDITGKKLSAEEMKAYNKQKSINDLVDLLNEYGHSDLIKLQLKILKKGIINLENLSFNEAVTLRSLLRNAEREAPGDLKNAFTKVKGAFNKAIDDATGEFSETRKLVDDYDNLLFNYRGSYLEDLTKQFGYGDSSRVLKPMQLTGNNRNAFQAFVNNTNESLNNAEKLGNILKGNAATVNQRNRIQSALYENYYNKVFPETAGGTGKMTHKQFMDEFGDNYKLILGEEKFNKFANSQKSALDTYQKFIDDQVKIQKVVSDKLPTLNINTLEFGDANSIVREIFLNGNKGDISGLIKGLQKIDPSLVNDIKKIYLRNFLNGVKVDRTLPNKFVGESRFATLDGNRLNEFINNNRSIIEQLYGKEFVAAHRDLAKALTLLQTDNLVTKGGAPGLTDAANKAGLFVDIFAGPLNHKRLILNRIGRIYDGFDLGGDSLALLRDYNRFVEASKKYYLGGNYPKILDKLGESSKPEYKTLFGKFFDAIKDPKYTGFKMKENPLIAKEYIKDKFENKRLPGETGVFTPVDEIIGSIVGFRGETAPKFLQRNLNPKIEKLVNNLLEAVQFRGKEKSEEIKRKQFEKQLAK